MVDPALMEARLRAYYAKHNPGNDQNMCVVCAYVEIVRKFAGREQELCAKLAKKYGTAPDLGTDAQADTATTSTSVTAGPAKSSSSAAEAQQVGSLVYERGFRPFQIPVSTGGALDFRSPDFDPLQALQKERLPSLTPAYPLDNILKCRHLLPESDPHYQKIVVHVKKTVSDASSSGKAEVVKKDPTPTPTLFDRLADGPFTMLRRCFLERKRVVVVVRRVNSIRGTCAGYLKAFDKHMNLVLMDVTETCVPHATHTRMLQDVRDGRVGAVEALFSVADLRRNRKFTQQLYSKQLFIRGDNVVMVSEERSRRVTAPANNSRAPRY